MPQMSTMSREVNAQKALLYGMPKVGKTFLAGQMSSHFKLLWIDCENGSDTLFNNLTDAQKANIFLIKIRNSRDLPIAAETITHLFRKPNSVHKICWGHGRINCVDCKRTNPQGFDDVNLSMLDKNWIMVIDSLSELSESILSLVAKDNAGFNLTESIGALDRLTQEQYGMQGHTLKALGSAIQSAPFHMICIAHEQDLATEKKPIENLVPTVGTKNMSKIFAKHFNHVIYCKRENRDHKASSSTKDSNTFVASSSSNLSMSKGATLLDIFTGGCSEIDKSTVVEATDVTNAAHAAAIEVATVNKGVGISQFAKKSQ